MTVKNFETAVSQVRTAIRRRLRTRDTVSAFEFTDVATFVRGAKRGAVMSTAFRQLQEEGVIKLTKQTVYNTQTKHRVAVYRAN